ncbi:Cwf19-like, C-terminal domain-1 [Akanthomyces lecanii RCEF 1005]|uniref:Cwf19-like, C-terminal domain-1 n=1 Tax=Akanthomyces lecanii RCEF 1005 TaxID=1081108 RepID=A0A168DVG2_CORDF|nr:Cwf19-like, C-terminal domain-1 [Akanthomyces lecanii RCEF 1005]
MDGLDEFEKQLAADKAERERTKDPKKHRHRHRDDDRHRRRHRDDDDDHRHKRRRRSRDKHDDSRHEHGDRDKHRARDRSERHKDKELEDKPSAEAGDAPVRDAWMTAPSALDIEHIHRAAPKEKTPPKEQERVISVREINRGLNTPASAAEASSEPKERVIDYTFGDSGSSWRMTKLRGVYDMANDTGRPVEDIAVERFGSLQDFDDAREEKQELDRAKSYGKGYNMKDTPTGEFYTERLANQKPIAPAPRPPSAEPTSAAPAATIVTPLDQTALNRLRAQMMKAKLRRLSNAAQLEEDYNRAAAGFSSSASAAQSVVLGGQDSRLLAGHIHNEVRSVDNKRGRERGTVVANEDMTVDDMLREERRTKGQAGGEGMRLAERIAKDGKFDDDLEYMDENAEKLAKRVHKSEMNLKNMAVSEFQKVNRILENCPLCHHEDTQKPPLAPVLALGTRVFLTLATEPEISPGGAVIVPTTHRRNLLECDDDEWEEMRNFMKSLTRMYHAQGREVLFYENAAAPNRHLHAAMMAVPIPYAEGATAPAYFKEAFLSADEEWSQHKKIIDTGAKAREGLGRMAFRRSLAKEMPYFHVWFTLDGGLGHIVEDAGRWPKGDVFAREVIGGIVDAEPHIVKKQGRWHRGDSRVDGFKKDWRKFDWTRVLTED